MTKYEFKQNKKEQRREKKLLRREHKIKLKDKKRSKTKTNWFDRFIRKVFVFWTPLICGIVIAVQAIMKLFIRTPGQPIRLLVETPSIHLGILRIKSIRLLDYYFSSTWLIVSTLVIASLLMLGLFLFIRYIKRAERSTDNATQIGKASDVYKPGTLQFFKILILGLIFVFIYSSSTMFQYYSVQLRYMVIFSLKLFIIGSVVSWLGITLHERKLRRYSKNEQYIDKRNIARQEEVLEKIDSL